MIFSPTVKKVSTAQVLRIIESAKDAELSRDLECEFEILRPIWADISQPPEVEYLPLALQAELLRLTGFLLSNWGRSKNLKNYQDRGNDLLSRAIHFFTELDLPDKVAEARSSQALCYWREGRIEEAEIILMEAQARFADNPMHPVYLQTQIALLMILFWRERFEESLPIIDKLKTPVELCHDFRLQATFNNQAGIIYRTLGDGNKSLYFLNESIRYARIGKAIRFEAKALNNTANTYRDLKQFDKAVADIEASIKIFEQLNDTGWLPAVLDTKATILMAQNKYSEALATINESLHFARQGEDARTLVESLWTKTEILTRLDRRTEALKVFAELVNKCQALMGESAADKYCQKLAASVFFRQSGNLHTETARVRREIIKSAFYAEQNNRFKRTTAAETLGVSHQSLSYILKTEFPDLEKELGLNVRAKRTDAKHRAVSPNRSDKLQTAGGLVAIELPATIRRKYRPEELVFVNLPHDKFRPLNPMLTSGAVLAAYRTSELGDGFLCLLRNVSANGGEFVGLLRRDADLRLYYVDFGDGEIVPVTEKMIITGRIAAVCPFSAVTEKILKFQILELVR